MIRPVTLVAFAAFIGSGLYLYQVKHQAQLVDREIRKVREATEAARQRAGVLRAEYALLNDPDRLMQLATAYVTDLKPTQPAQWSSMAEIERRLPPVGAPTMPPAPLEPAVPDRADPIPIATAAPPRAEPKALRSAAAQTAAPTAAPATAFAQPGAQPAIHPSAPVAVAARVAEPAPARMAATQPTTRPTGRGASNAAPPVAQAARAPAPALQAVAQAAPLAPTVPATPQAQPAPAPVQFASAAPPAPRPRPAPSLLPRVSPPSGASVLAIASRPAGQRDAYGPPPTTPAEAVARIARGAPVDPSVPVVASALGMARTMMPASPVSPASAGTLYPRAAR